MKNLIRRITFDKWFDVFVSVVIACSVALIDKIGFAHSDVEAALMGSGFAFCICLLEEAIKSFIPGRRAFEAINLLADLIGFIVGFILSLSLLYMWYV